MLLFPSAIIRISSLKTPSTVPLISIDPGPLEFLDDPPEQDMWLLYWFEEEKFHPLDPDEDEFQQSRFCSTPNIKLEWPLGGQFVGGSNLYNWQFWLLEDINGIDVGPELVQLDFDPNAPHESLLSLFWFRLLSLFEPKLLLSPQTDMFACSSADDNCFKLEPSKDLIGYVRQFN